MREKIPDETTVTTTYPECGAWPFPQVVKLIVRTNSFSEEQFLGCPNYPDCRHTQSLSEAMRMRLAGHPILF